MAGCRTTHYSYRIHLDAETGSCLASRRSEGRETSIRLYMYEINRSFSDIAVPRFPHFCQQEGNSGTSLQFTIFQNPNFSTHN